MHMHLTLIMIVEVERAAMHLHNKGTAAGFFPKLCISVINTDDLIVDTNRAALFTDAPY